jgi:aromatic-L-amino-acid decarboxylase
MSLLTQAEAEIRELSEPDELSLDPADWDSFRQLAHAALDEALGFVKHVRDRAVWQPTPAAVREHLLEPLPREGESLDRVYDEFRQRILPYGTGNIHPRFFGWVHGAGLPQGIVAEMLSAAMNCNCGGRDHVAIYVERAVLAWCKELFGFPESASGLLVSGTSMANLIALGAARHAADEEIRKNGLQQTSRELVAYCSSQTHESVAKAMELLGLGANALRKVAVRSDYAIDIAALREAVSLDRAAGREPFCIIGCAGTVNTGATDDLDELARLCEAERIWFHVDGAFGAMCMLSEQLRGRMRGLERADSLAFDFHKWTHVQYDAGCVLVRNSDVHRGAYAIRPAYLQNIDRGLAGGGEWPCDYGLELSRGFRALKIWFALKQHGTRKLGQLVEQNCAQAKYLEARIAAEPELELLAPVPLNIVCFRFYGKMAGESELDELNEAIVADVQESGVAAPSTTRIEGRLAIRVNITNHRTRRSDMDVLVDAVLCAGRARKALTFNHRDGRV